MSEYRTFPTSNAIHQDRKAPSLLATCGTYVTDFDDSPLSWPTTAWIVDERHVRRICHGWSCRGSLVNQVLELLTRPGVGAWLSGIGIGEVWQSLKIWSGTRGSGFVTKAILPLRIGLDRSGRRRG